jgi:hypothetical protein
MIKAGSSLVLELRASDFGNVPIFKILEASNESLSLELLFLYMTSDSRLSSVDPIYFYLFEIVLVVWRPERGDILRIREV